MSIILNLMKSICYNIIQLLRSCLSYSGIYSVFHTELFKLKSFGLISIFFFQFSFGNENISHYENLFQHANEYYSKGNYDSAIIMYRNIVNAEYESVSLYYNFGNAYYKMKNIPSAILYFEKAKKLAPDDNDVLFNLQLTNQQITDKIEPLPELFYKKWWNEIISAAAMDSWAKWTIILAIYALLMFVFFVLAESVTFKKIYFWSGIAGIIFAVFSFSFAMKQEKFLIESNEAIVFSSSITAKVRPMKTALIYL